MIEMGGNGIQLSSCRETAHGGEKAYLLRLSPEKDPAPLIAAAKRYLDEDVQYDYPDLIFFAGLLIYRTVRPTPRWQKITDLILMGMQTEYCIDATCKAAFELGYGVVIPTGATTTYDNEFMSGEATVRFYEEKIWAGRFADLMPAEAVLGLLGC